MGDELYELPVDEAERTFKEEYIARNPYGYQLTLSKEDFYVIDQETGKPQEVTIGNDPRPWIRTPDQVELWNRIAQFVNDMTINKGFKWFDISSELVYPPRYPNYPPAAVSGQTATSFWWVYRKDNHIRLTLSLPLRAQVEGGDWGGNLGEDDEPHEFNTGPAASALLFDLHISAPNGESEVAENFVRELTESPLTIPTLNVPSDFKVGPSEGYEGKFGQGRVKDGLVIRFDHWRHLKIRNLLGNDAEKNMQWYRNSGWVEYEAAMPLTKSARKRGPSVPGSDSGSASGAGAGASDANPGELKKARTEAEIRRALLLNNKDPMAAAEMLSRMP